MKKKHTEKMIWEMHKPFCGREQIICTKCHKPFSERISVHVSSDSISDFSHVWLKSTESYKTLCDDCILNMH